MLVALDLIQVRPESGGVYTLVRGLLPELLRRHPEHEWHVYYAEDVAPLADAHDGAHLHPLPKDYLAHSLDRAVWKLQPDVCFRGFPFARPLRFPVEKQVVLIPDLQHEYLEDCFPKHELPQRQEAFRAAQAGAGALGTLSHAGLESLRKSPWTKCSDLFLMPPGASPAQPGGDLPAAVRDRTFFYYPANLWPHKNHAVLLDAFQRFAAAQAIPVWLVLTGNPQGWPELRARFPNAPVLHLGRIPDAQVWALYRRARALCFFSRFEGFGIPLLEAFASDLPVACSNVCSLPEVGGNAVLSCDPCDPQAIADTLGRIHRDEDLRARLVAAGRARLEAYTWAQSAENLHAALLRVGVLKSIARVELDSNAPDLSVVIPLLGHRGHLERCLDSFLTQTCSPDRFEIGLAANGSQPDLEAHAEAKIRGRGWLRRFEAAGLLELYHRGALSARTPLLLLSESHCEAKPETVAGVLEFFERSGLPGGLLHAESKNANEFASFEGDLYEETLRLRRTPGDWRRVSLRGFAVRRAVLERVGGFDYRYGLFAEQVLAATLRAYGYPLGFLQGVPIIHCNTEDWSHLGASIRDYAAAECAYRLAHHPKWFAQTFNVPPRLEARQSHDSAQAGLLLETAVRAACSAELSLEERARLLRTLCATFAALALPRVLGLYDLRLRLRLACALARTKVALLPSRTARFEAYRAGWSNIADLQRVRSLAGKPLQNGVPPGGASGLIEDCLEWQVPGFHLLEQHAGRWFRWSGPVAVLRLPARPADVEATLDLGDLPRSRHPILFFNGTRVPDAAIVREARGLRFPLRRRDFVEGPVQDLAMVCKPLPARALAPKDARRLCLPVFGWSLREDGS